MRVVIMGCGRVGASLADAMQGRGHTVSVIDKSAEAFARLSPGFNGTTTVGMGFDRDILTRAGIEAADAFAAVSSGDNSNIVAARVARETFGVERVVARIYDARRAQVYARLGIPTVATVPWTTERFVAELDEDVDAVAWRDPSGSVDLIQLDIDESWIGVSVAKFSEETGCQVVFLNRVGRPILPEPRTALQDDDLVYVAVRSADRAAVRATAAAPRPAHD
ncbi:potassium channel family protein [Gordonia araii]|uniref:potassium channel family protein n=1 Tax=Gordonia araii TaxID=263909 RepID=UPI000303A109|nr:TrkA family potassium uptake protein [Gordonia araii]NNG95832.1 TrkA family potassium uptake protein [Gordonia araii NBRC 100433]